MRGLDSLSEPEEQVLLRPNMDRMHGHGGKRATPIAWSPMQVLPSSMQCFPGRTKLLTIASSASARLAACLSQRLARAGFRSWDSKPVRSGIRRRDWVSDEKGSHELYWNDLRIIGGTHPLALGANNSGKGVGGGSVHWAAFAPRFHPSDFRVYTEDGVGVDWPISYWD